MSDLTPRNLPIAGEVLAGVPTGPPPRSLPTIERSERDSARHHAYNAGTERAAQQGGRSRSLRPLGRYGVNDFYPPLDINPYERCRRPSRRQRDGLIVGKVVAGVPTRRAPRTSPTIERSERDSARHHPYNAGYSGKLGAVAIAGSEASSTADAGRRHRAFEPTQLPSTLDVSGPQDGSAHSLEQWHICLAVAAVRIPSAPVSIKRMLAEPNEVDHHNGTVIR